MCTAYAESDSSAMIQYGLTQVGLHYIMSAPL